MFLTLKEGKIHGLEARPLALSDATYSDNSNLLYVRLSDFVLILFHQADLDNPGLVHFAVLSRGTTKAFLFLAK